MTTAASSCIGFPLQAFAKRGTESKQSPYSLYSAESGSFVIINPCSREKVSISDTGARGMCVLCCGTLWISTRGPCNRLHIKKRGFVKPRSPGGPVVWPTFMSSPNPETSFESLKKAEKSRVSSPLASRSWREKEGEGWREGGGAVEGEGTMKCVEILYHFFKRYKHAHKRIFKRGKNTEKIIPRIKFDFLGVSRQK